MAAERMVATELKAIGLDVPQVTEVFTLLREAGIPLPDDVYTVRQAIAALTARKGGSEAC